MNRSPRVAIRTVEPSDLDTFFAHQRDPVAIHMAAFVAADPDDRTAFDAHWARILQAPRTTNRTILADGQVAGHIACYPQGEDLEVTYWLGRDFWGQGIATRALQLMLALVVTRPVLARAATDNLGSLRVLQKCGFKIVGTNKDFANGRGTSTEEYLLRLDPEEPTRAKSTSHQPHTGEPRSKRALAHLLPKTARVPDQGLRTARIENPEARMRNPFKASTSNPWLEKDRQDQRRIIATGVIFASAVVGGLGWLIHALLNT